VRCAVVWEAPATEASQQQLHGKHLGLIDAQVLCMQHQAANRQMKHVRSFQAHERGMQLQYGAVQQQSLAIFQQRTWGTAVAGALSV
jgi:hypothetical protein